MRAGVLGCEGGTPTECHTGGTLPPPPSSDCLGAVSARRVPRFLQVSGPNSTYCPLPAAALAVPGTFTVCHVRGGGLDALPLPTPLTVSGVTGYAMHNLDLEIQGVELSPHDRYRLISAPACAPSSANATGADPQMTAASARRVHITLPPGQTLYVCYAHNPRGASQAAWHLVSPALAGACGGYPRHQFGVVLVGGPIASGLACTAFWSSGDWRSPKEGTRVGAWGGGLGGGGEALPCCCPVGGCRGRVPAAIRSAASSRGPCGPPAAGEPGGRPSAVAVGGGDGQTDARVQQRLPHYDGHVLTLWHIPCAPSSGRVHQ